MIDPVLDYLQAHGENVISNVRIDLMSHMSIEKRLRVLHKQGRVLRRYVVLTPGSKKKLLAYRVWGQAEVLHSYPVEDIKEKVELTMKEEPDYAFILRNLPRKEDGLSPVL